MGITITQSINVEPQDIFNDLCEGVDFSANSAAILFIAPDIDYNEVNHLFAGKIPYIGCTTVANFSIKQSKTNGRDETASLVLFPKCGDGKNPIIGTLKDISIEGAKYIAFSVADDDLDAQLQGISVVGGLAADDWEFDSCKIFLNGKVLDSGTVALDISCYSTDTSSISGWTPIADSWPGIVTKAEGREVFEIAGISAFDFYQGALLHRDLFGACPLKLSSTGVLRAALTVNEEVGSITFSGEISEGETVTIMSATRAEVINSTQQLIIENKKDIISSDFVFAFSCAARNRILADLSHKEFDYLKEFKSEVILVSLYGEFTPFENDSLLENQHLVLCMLSK